MVIASGISKLLEAGRLSQTCPCGVTEAAGSYCTRCLRPMSEADWRRAERLEQSEVTARPLRTLPGPLTA